MLRILKSVKAVRGLLAAYHVVKDPTRLDEVIAITDNLVRPEIVQAIVDDVSRFEVGARALIARPRVHIDLDALDRLAPGTLGRSFAEHMRKNHLDPADLPTRPANTTHEFVRAHLLETHDIWHAVTGFDTDVAGELGLQAFYMAQIPSRLAPILLAGGLLNTIFYAWDDRVPRMEQITLGWRMGRDARPFFGVEWNRLWTTPIDQVRADLGVRVPVVAAA